MKLGFMSFLYLHTSILHSIQHDGWQVIAALLWILIGPTSVTRRGIVVGLVRIVRRSDAVVMATRGG